MNKNNIEFEKLEALDPDVRDTLIRGLEPVVWQLKAIIDSLSPIVVNVKDFKKPALTVQELAVFMHNIYIKIARIHGWIVQPQTAVPFDRIPPVNKVVMFSLAEKVLGWFEGLENEIEPVEILAGSACPDCGNGEYTDIEGYPEYVQCTKCKQSKLREEVIG